MEPIQILEAIKEDIRDKFDGDPLMMRTMNLVITEYKARSERLHKHGVMRPDPNCPHCKGSGGVQTGFEEYSTCPCVQGDGLRCTGA